jgi:RNA polymerase sigma-70 factor (ECF subfamily)
VPGAREPQTVSDRAAEFQEYRGFLLSVAYRLIGSWADAEDVVAQAWPRWEVAEGVQTPRAWLTRVVSRIALDHLRSARVRRETYVGPWLPEPLVTGMPAIPGPAPAPDPAEELVRDESVRLAFLVVLDTLSPEQRISLVLHDVLDLPFADVADVLGCPEATARQHAVRARRRIAAADPAPRAPDTETRAVLERLAAALAADDGPALAALLAPDVVLLNDGAGEVAAAVHPVHGADRVSRLLLGLQRGGAAGATFQVVLVNGDPGFLIRGEPQRPHYPEAAVFGFAIRNGLIEGIYGVVAPEKLSRLPDPPGRRRPRPARRHRRS